MGRAVLIPEALKRRPFTLADARAVGIRRKSLFGKSWRRLASELYCWHEWAEEPWPLLAAWQRLLPEDAVFCGPTAAWLWGVGFQPLNPVHVVVPPTSGVRPRRGLTVRRRLVGSEETASVRGLVATALLRTLRDLCVRLPVVEVLISMDRALFTSQTTPSQICQYGERLKGHPGAALLRELAPVTAPAESPMETRLRWLLLEAGLPRPEVQVDLRDDGGQFLGRADIYYPAARLAIEYDGVNHRDRLVEDNRRQNGLINAGFKLLRFMASDLDRPEVVASVVRQALNSSHV